VNLVAGPLDREFGSQGWPRSGAEGLPMPLP
jgi:hypothetical protein